MTWEIVWKIVFVIVMAAFAVMAVAVTFLGARDIKRLLSALRESSDEVSSNQQQQDQNV